MDHIDRKIISLLSKDPGLSQNEISDFLGISQPAVSARITKMKKDGILIQTSGLNAEKVGMILARLDLKTKDNEEILDFSKKCPLCISSLIMSGTYNLCLFFIGENMMSIEACIDKHIRGKPTVSDLELNYVISSPKGFILPLRIREKKIDSTPCEEFCQKCSYYFKKKCMGCPDTESYKGSIF